MIIKYKVRIDNNAYGNTIVSTGRVQGIQNTQIENLVARRLTSTEQNKIEESYEELKSSYNGKELINEIYKDAVGVDLKLDSFDIKSLVKLAQDDSWSASKATMQKDNYMYDAILNKYFGVLVTREHEANQGFDVPSIYEYALRHFKDYGDPDRLADQINGENFFNGDILIYLNSNDVQYDKNGNIKKYITFEDGEYAYIYISGKGFVGVNLGADGIKDTNDDRDAFTYSYYEEHQGDILGVYTPSNGSPARDSEYHNYQTLFGKDYYVILRPAQIEGFRNTYKYYGIPGDVNKDKNVDVIDLRLLLQTVINRAGSQWTQEELAIMDLNGDKDIDIVDVRLLLQICIND